MVSQAASLIYYHYHNCVLLICMLFGVVQLFRTCTNHCTAQVKTTSFNQLGVCCFIFTRTVQPRGIQVLLPVTPSRRWPSPGIVCHHQEIPVEACGHHSAEWEHLHCGKKTNIFVSMCIKLRTTYCYTIVSHTVSIVVVLFLEVLGVV